MNWREKYDDPFNLAEMVRIEAKWVREKLSAHTASVLEDAADALEELAAEPQKSGSNPLCVAKFETSSFVMVNDVAVLEGEE